MIYPYILGEEAPFSLGLGKGKETGSLPQGDSQDAAGSQDGSGAQDGQGAGGQDASGSQSGGDNTQQTQGPAGTGVVEGQQNITQTGTTPQTQGTESGGQQSGTAAGTDTTNSQGGSSPGANGIVLYTIQYGSFTTTEAAKEAVTSLETAPTSTCN